MPTKQKRQKKRVQLGIIVSREAKKKIEEMARDEGRSQGQICEELIKKGLDYDSRLAAIHDKLEEIGKSNAEMGWPRAGYVPVHTEHGIIYVPRGHPGVQPFVEYRSGEPQPEPVEVPPSVPLSEAEAAKNLRDLQERIARLEALAKEAEEMKNHLSQKSGDAAA